MLTQLSTIVCEVLGQTRTRNPSHLSEVTGWGRAGDRVRVHRGAS